MRLRKDVKSLTPQQRRDYVDAVLKLKSVPSPYDKGLSYYDQFVAWHVGLYYCDPQDPLLRSIMRAHGGPMFGPWHRRYLLLFEDALRAVSGKEITVPYWDWTDPDSTRAVFTDTFMGGDGDPTDDFAVKSGPFRKDQWKLVVNPPGFLAGPSATTYLTRHFGSLFPLPTAAELESALTGPQYDTPPYDSTSDSALSFRNNWEGFRSPAGAGPPGYVCGSDGVVTPNLNADGAHNHNAAHAWVGGIRGVTPEGVPQFGTMVLPSSPNDPTFFLLHANIDRIWARWQGIHGTDSYQPTEGSPGNNVDDPMHPFDKIGITAATPETVADIRQLGYRYADTGTSATFDAALRTADQRSFTARIQLVCHLPGPA